MIYRLDLKLSVVDAPFFLRYGYGYDRGFVDFEWIMGQSCKAGDYTILSDVSRYRRFEAMILIDETAIIFCFNLLQKGD